MASSPGTKAGRRPGGGSGGPSGGGSGRVSGGGASGAARFRLVPLAALFVVVAAGVWLARASMVDVGDHERAFRVSSIGGGVTRLAPGRQVVVPGLQRLVRLTEGPIHAASSAKIRTKEGVELEIPFDVEGTLSDQALEKSLAAGGGPPDQAAAAAATEVVEAWGHERPPDSVVFEEGAAEAETKLRARLEGQGWSAVSLRLGKVSGAGGAAQAIATGTLRERTQKTGVKIAILGLDGADWELIDPLLARGELPNLARLKGRGAWGNMKTMVPTLSPLLWTSMATGKTPEEHGIVDFLVKDRATGKPVPVSSRSRRVQALWNMFTAAGRKSAFVAWWGTWPAEQVDGWMVSDRVAYSLFGFVKGEGGLPGATWPAAYLQEIRPKLVDHDSIALAELQQFVPVTAGQLADLRRQVEADPRTGYRQPVNHLSRILASEKSYQAIGLDILARGQPDLFSIYYQGIDEVCHRFAQFMPPKMDIVTAEEFAAYRDVVARYYRYQDRLLGEVLAKLSPDTVVIVVSDHGFQNGSGRPHQAPDIENSPGLWHRKYGVFIMAGPGIHKGRLDTVPLLDITPTVLYLAGLPQAQDMPGHVIKEGIEPSFLARFPPQSLPSYEPTGRAPSEDERLVPSSEVETEMVENLRSLGYIGGASPGGEDQTAPAPTPGSAGGAGPAGTASGGAGDALVTAHLNAAGALVKRKEFPRAEQEIEQALKMQPDFVGALLLKVNIEEGLGKWDEAIAVAKRVIATHPEEDPRIYDELDRIYAAAGRLPEGIAYFRDLAARQPDKAEIRAALGALLLRGHETAAGEKELLEALRLNPALPEPLTELHALYKDTPRVLTLEPVVRRGLEINDRSVVHLNWMGIIFQHKGDAKQAEAYYKRALELDPDHAGTMANLGALYGRTGRLEEAVAVLRRAVAKDPDNVESWVNLGAAQGRLGRPRDAIQSLETARAKGVRTTTLFNALAIAYLQEHQPERAMRYLKESLQIDPNQKDATELMRAMSRPS